MVIFHSYVSLPEGKHQKCGYGDFHKWWYPKWMVYFMENPYEHMDDLEVALFQETTIFS
jgi:hypothetical protein